ncbi:hypothetical protein KF728_14975 [Candidatus Obscuribacterales bacterium]|nr:hypothetical protein [Candidatus Obscuribacterales bacterium]MBX3151454.1 hypothetical protein [Candidatus Obscuribacterales bacterium]
MNNQKKDVPKVQPAPSKGGPGGRETAIGAGEGGCPEFIHFAQEEARRLGHNFVGTEMMLVALLRCYSGIAPSVLSDLGLTVENARAEMESIIGRGSGSVFVDIPFTPRAMRVLELSWDEARQLGRNYIGTEHLLLGIVREGEGVGSRILDKFGVDAESLRNHVYRQLSAESKQ